MFEFGNPQYLKLLWLIPIAIAPLLHGDISLTKELKNLARQA